MQDSTEIYIDEGVTAEYFKAPSNGSAHLDNTTDDRWKLRIDVALNGNIEIVTGWQDSTLSDGELPEWAGDVTARPARV
ncbi:hypothetical protein ACOJIV_02765 [Haloarcula sp. AONF1]